MPMDSFPLTPVMQAIAAENNLSETGFLVPAGGAIALRWFTTHGRGTLLRPRYLGQCRSGQERLEPGRNKVVFHSASGPLTVQPGGYGLRHGLPCPPVEPVATPPVLAEALGVVPIEVFVNSFNYMVFAGNTQAIAASFTPDMAALARMDRSG